MPKWTTPFVKQVASDNILFGYDPGSKEFFEHRHPDRALFQAELARWQALLPKETPARQLVELNW